MSDKSIGVAVMNLNAARNQLNWESNVESALYYLVEAVNAIIGHLADEQ